MSGRLYVVATPIGNLEDLTFRAARILKSVQLIACEDTRVSKKLLDHYQIETPTIACHAHSTPDQIEQLIDRLTAGEDLALISDAGTPILSDPGQALVSGAIARGIEVVPIPGASALLAALTAAGIDAPRFVFLGFLPRSEGERRERIAAWKSSPAALVIYEAPNRTGETLRILEQTLGDREACVARELTKHFETFDRGRLSVLAEKYREGARGEVVLIVAPPGETEEIHSEAAIDEEIDRLLAAGTSPTDAAKLIAKARGLTKQDAYRRVLEAQQRLVRK